jgi:glycosyltransferase involved in cell wall biosynthesis
LLAAGYLLNEHRDYLASVEQRLRDWGLGAEFTYAGAPDRAGKIALIRQMDVFSVPAVYAEPKGLSLLEAMANGIPIVQPRRGAFTEIVQRTDGGILVAPDAPDSLADALLALLVDRDRAAAMGRTGAERVRRHYSAAEMAENAEKVYAEMLARPVRA